jgi:hypothetical protein
LFPSREPPESSAVTALESPQYPAYSRVFADVCSRLLVTPSAEIELRSFVSASDIEIGSSGTVRGPAQLAQIVGREGAFLQVAVAQAKIAFWSRQIRSDIATKVEIVTARVRRWRKLRPISERKVST